jgi:hypothetical protein
MEHVSIVNNQMHPYLICAKNAQIRFNRTMHFLHITSLNLRLFYFPKTYYNFSSNNLN